MRIWQSRKVWMVAAAMSMGLVLTKAHAVQAAVPISGQGTWQTTLKGRDLDGNLANGFEAFYDTELNITWLADANYAKSTGFDANGQMNWNAAMSWVSGLNVSGVTGWRLPSMLDTGTPGCNFSSSGGADCGYFVQTKLGSTVYSELAYMFYVSLGHISGSGLENSGPFKNLSLVGDGARVFWTNVEDQTQSSKAWVFSMTGTQREQSVANKISTIGSSGEYFSWAVHDGDIGVASSVPEPEAWALAMAGLGIAALIWRRAAA
jgi:PEP-CTERM motif